MNNLEIFEQKHMMAFIELQSLTKQKKALEERDKEIRDILVKGMDEYGIESIDNEYVNIIRIKATPGKPKLDEKSWRAEDPEGYNEVFSTYNKMAGAKKAHVRITTK